MGVAVCRRPIFHAHHRRHCRRLACPFVITAVIDLLWIVAWLAIYKKPEDHPRVNKAELAIIQGDDVEPTVKIPWLKLLLHRQTWAFCVAKGMTDCFWWFYLFGSPDFFNKKFGLAPTTANT